jgi:phosphoglycerol transferase MdoB-like AlkP superfamily enzyme
VSDGPRAERRATRGAWLLFVLTLFAMISPLALAMMQWPNYRKLLGLPTWHRGDLPFEWLLYSQAASLLLVALAMTAVAILMRWRKLAVGLFCVATLLLFTWFTLEQDVFARTGLHVLAYAAFVQRPSNLGGAQWGGDLKQVLFDAAGSVWSVLRFALLGLLLCAVLWRVIIRSRLAPYGKPFALWSAILFGLLVFGAYPAQLCCREVRVLSALHAALPVDMRWTAPGVMLSQTEAFNKSLRSGFAIGFDRKLADALRPLPTDSTNHLDGAPARPNVIFIVVESLRYSALSPDVMPRLDSLSRRGLLLQRHFAGSNMSQTGLYSLLYSRPAFTYEPNVDQRIVPSACAAFRAAGYHCVYLSGAMHAGWMKMDRFITAPSTFDECHIMHQTLDWCARDRAALKQLKERLTDASQPQFATIFLISTHYNYMYPPEYAKRPNAMDAQKVNLYDLTPEDRPGLLDRYRNSAGFLDDEIGRFIDSIDLSKNIVVITGDHGESIFDDGTIGHCGRLSEIQTRVPCVIIGAGVPRRDVTAPTDHGDVLPTVLSLIRGSSVRLAHTTGDDVTAPGYARSYEMVSPGREAGPGLTVALFGPRSRVQFHLAAGELPNAEGTLNQAGQLDTFQMPPPTEAKRWSDAFAGMVGRLVE